MHWLGTLSPCVWLDVKDFVLVLVAWVGVHAVILMWCLYQEAFELFLILLRLGPRFRQPEQRLLSHCNSTRLRAGNVICRSDPLPGWPCKVCTW